MVRLYAKQARVNPALLPEIKHQIEEKWRNASALGLLFAEATAETRSAQLRYLQGLCKQEEAEIQQARLDLRQRGGGNAADAEEVRETWRDALSAWELFLQDHPTDPARGAVQQLRARALSQLGRWEEAAQTWESLDTPRQPLEKVAGLYQAKQIRKANPK